MFTVGGVGIHHRRDVASEHCIAVVKMFTKIIIIAMFHFKDRET